MEQRKRRLVPLSLHPLVLDEALASLIAVKPAGSKKKAARKPKAARKKGKKRKS